MDFFDFNKAVGISTHKYVICLVQAKLAKKVFDAQREFIVLASTCQKPSQVSTGKITFISSGEICFECFTFNIMNLTL